MLGLLLGWAASSPSADVATGAPAAVPADLIGMAVSDAARRLGIARNDVKLVAADAVVWPDGSLGCPQPGMMYAQALVPGYRILLRASGQELNYHASKKGGPTFCPAERVAPPLARGSAE
ncbi:MAG: hypothetical protein ACR2I8_03670 [Steroidobacteraceae bacterium]